ncbi:MAG: sigma-54 dependent transcriptional regulator [Lentisphaeria bacterium]
MMKKAKILIIDDERNTRTGLEAALNENYDVLLAEEASKGIALLKKENVDIVLTDLRMPGMNGMDFTKEVSAWDNAPLIIMLTAYGSVETALEAMKVGAYDYLTKPINLDNLEMMIERGLDVLKQRRANVKLRQEMNSGKKVAIEGIIGSSECMLELIDQTKQIADARSTVLITGESGTGKEVFAHAIHNLSLRNKRPFVAVHCASLNENLLESELFGHEKGAFTGATERKIGRFESADGGSLFLDEIGEISPATQVKLLRVLEIRALERVGGTESIKINVRLLAATNRDLKAMVSEGTFREDLYYRLNVVNLHMPALRDHAEDIPLLLNYYLKLVAEENDKKITGFAPEAVKVLLRYDWPGNIRELRNTVERMVVLTRGTSLTIGDIPEEIRSGLGNKILKKEEAEAQEEARTETPVLDLKVQEKNNITKALKNCNGNRSRAAELLGISRRTLHRKLNEYNIQ